MLKLIVMMILTYSVSISTTLNASCNFGRSRERTVDSEEHRGTLDEDRMVKGEMREGQEVIIKRLGAADG